MIGSRIARPTNDLARSVEFYRGVLGLQHTGGFEGHDGYDGAFFALPGGGELELTAGPVPPTEWSEEDLLVLYLPGHAELQRWEGVLAGHGVSVIPAANPYWNRNGITVRDPDGFRVVLATRDVSLPPVTLGWFDGDRTELRPLFALAEDSAELLDAYVSLGSVLVAREAGIVVGHLQLVHSASPDEVELKNMAVLDAHRGRGIGRQLVDEAVRHSMGVGHRRMIVATAAADIGNLRFYQRVGFRFSAVERDAFTPQTGYPEPIVIDGIELRDRVWFTRDLIGAPS